MDKVISNGKIGVGAYQFRDRKRPSICVVEGNTVIVCGSFHNEHDAEFFMGKLMEVFGLKEG